MISVFLFCTFISIFFPYSLWKELRLFDSAKSPIYQLNLTCLSSSFLIIVNFHWASYQHSKYVLRNVEFFQKYFKFKSEYIFVGPVDSYDGIRIYSNSLPPNGYYSYYSFNIALIHQKKKYQGYIFMNDDSLISPFVFNTLNLSVPFGALYGVNRNPKTWWNPTRNRYNITFWEAQNKFIKEILEKGILKHNVTRYMGYSDFFYVSSDYAQYAADMFYYAMKNAVFLEMAVPTMLHNINASYSLPECNHGWNKSYHCLKLNYDSCVHMHPVKMGIPAMRNTILSYYKNMSTPLDRGFCYR